MAIEMKNGVTFQRLAGITKVVGKKTTNTDKESTYVKMEVFTRENGQIVSEPGRENICANDYVHQGKWKEDKRDGPCKIVRQDASSYEGGWKDDKMHGQVKHILDDMGRLYKGQCKNGKKHGVGKYANENGIVYEGEYKDGRKDGQGTHSGPNGTSYEGKYLEGKNTGKE